MPLRLPEDDDLYNLASELHIGLTAKEVEDFQSVLPALFEGYHRLDQMPSDLPFIKYPNRSVGARPPRTEDPYNAIVRRCSIKGASSGKLAGKRIGLKDNICVAGIPITFGSRVMDGYVPDIDATIATRMLDAGAEITAILNMEDFAFSGSGDSSAYGACLNPHSQEHLAGGSSSGSAAALYYDDIDMSIGGDQGGSIRIPASWCGIVGLKPTYGLVPYTGIGGIGHTFDHTVPMTRTVADNALLLEVIAGKDPLDPRQGEVTGQSYTEALHTDISGIRVGLVTEGLGSQVSESDVDAAVRQAVQQLAQLGAQVTEISIPEHTEGLPIWSSIAMQEATALFQSNGLGYFSQGLYNESLGVTLGKFRHAQGEDLPPTLKLGLLMGSYLIKRYHGRLYSKAQNLRRGWRAAYDRHLSEVDVLAMPTTPMKAQSYIPDIDRRTLLGRSWNMLDNTGPFDITGHPSLSIPCARSNGLPVGLMLTGRHFDESTLYRVAYAFEQQVDWQSH